MEHELDEVVATPKRLSKLLREMDTLSLRAVRHLRWTRLFDMGVTLLLPPTKDSRRNSSPRQTQLLSAIIPSSALRCATRWWSGSTQTRSCLR